MHAMPRAFIVHEQEVAASLAEGDTATERTTIGAAQGCQRLEQRLIRFAPGRSLERGDVQRDELLFVASGAGTLELDGTRHDLVPDTAVYLRAGERYAVENPGPEELHVVSVATPGTDEERPQRRVTVRFEDQPELRADDKRTFRYLVNQDAGCLDATQFLGIVQPCRAPDHSHTYDEVGYIVEGQGLAHADGRSIPLAAGSCFHLPPGKIHCIENTGPGVMRILGVFHPSGDPASRAYADDS